MHLIAFFHASGRPALGVSASLVASAAALTMAIARDHDRRGDERWYRKATRGLWAMAFSCLLIAAAIGFAESVGWLPETDGSIGLLSPGELRGLFASPRVSLWLSPHVAFLNTVVWTSLAVALGAALLARALGVSPGTAPVSPQRGAFGALILVSLLVCATLIGVESLASGGPSWAEEESHDEFRSSVAAVQTLTLMGLYCTTCLLAFTVLGVLRRSGIVYDDEPTWLE